MDEMIEKQEEATRIIEAIGTTTLNECYVPVINLLPCPFCGSKAEKRVREGTSDYDWDKVYYDIRCTNNDCYLQDGADWNCKTYEEVVEIWNKRQ